MVVVAQGPRPLKNWFIELEHRARKVTGTAAARGRLSTVGARGAPRGRSVSPM
jgi:hypothetical protein